MGFFNQLKLLLWKNYTVKKRHPFVLLAELIIPLVIFFVLVGIRLREEPRRYETYNSYIQPLPSAGLLPFINKFCPGGERNRDSIFADFIKVLSSLHENNTLMGDNQKKNLKRTPSGKGEQSSTLGNFSWIQNPESDLNLFNSELLWKVNLTLNDALLDYKLDEVTKLMIDEFGEDDGNDLSNTLRSQNITLAVLYDMYKMKDELEQEISEDGPGFGAIMFSKLFPNIGKWSNENSLGGASEIKTVINDLSFVFAERAKDPSDRYRSKGSLSSGLCSLMVKGMLKNVGLDSSALLNTLTYELLCEDSRQAESDLALLILSSVNATKALNSAYNNVGHNFSAARFDLYSSFSKDVDELFSLADYLLTHSVNASSFSDENGDGSLAEQKEANMLRFFLNIAPAICGKEQNKGDDNFNIKSVDKSNLRSSLKKLDMHYEMIKFSEVGLYLLQNNPHILFAPNTSSQVRQIIANANKSLAMVDAMTYYAKDWLKTSADLRNTLKVSDSFQSSFIFSQAVVKREEMCDQLFNMFLVKCILLKAGFGDKPEPSRMNTFENFSSVSPWLRDSREKTANFFELLMAKLERIDEAATRWISFAENVSLDLWMGFRSEYEAESWFQKEAYRNKIGVLAIVAFETDEKDQLGSNVKYKIRQNSTLINSPTHEELTNFWMPTIRTDMATARKYFINGFVVIQDVIERSIIEVITNKTVKEPGLHLETFPVPCSIRDHFLFTVSYVMPLCMTVAWAYSVAMLVQYIVYEKEQGLKEVTRLMGLSNAVHWVAWFISAFAQMQLIAILTALILKLGNILPHSNLLLTWAFLTLYNIANIMFSFLVSVLYSKAKVAAACAGIIYFLTYVPYLYVSIMEDSHLLGKKVSPKSKYLASLCSTTAFGLGAKYFAVYEAQGTGVQFGNLGYSPFQNDEFNLADVAKMMIIDSIIYALLAWYIEAVFPGKFGLPRPVYFPFTKSYWFSNKRKASAIHEGLQDRFNGDNGFDCSATETTKTASSGQVVECEPVGLQLGVCIEKLTKNFRSTSKPAVDNLSLNLYQSQITALLGHNGAGKTTTMSILTGMIPTSDGTAIIYGNDIHDGMDMIRKSLGMCPQHNVLFESLTVEEHLWFYASLKEMTSNDVYYAVNTLLRDVGMELKRVDLVDTLSGGMKRKLSVAIAFIGNAKLVILDEPTAGVDPYARRAIWDLILKFKKGRTILLSTHYMDEADFLADRIAIMSSGRLKCCGSSMFLKSNYGSGYHLKLVKDQSSNCSFNNSSLSHSSLTAQQRQVSQRSESFRCSTMEDSSDANGNAAFETTSYSVVSLSATILTFIENFIEGAYLDWESNRELSFTLPYSQRINFSQLLDSLQNSISELGISSFGVRDTSLEEVFIKAIVDDSRSHHINKQERYKQVFNWFYRRTARLTNFNSYNQPSNNGANMDSPDYKFYPKIASSSPTTPNVSFVPKKSSSFLQKHKKVVLETEENKFIDLNSDSSCDLDRGRAVTKSTNDKELLHRDNSFIALDRKMNRYPLLDENNMHTSNGNETCSIPPIMSWWLLYLRQLKALLKKRFLYARRNVKAVFTQIFLPSMFVSIAMTVAFYRPTSGSDPPVVMSTSNYHRYTGWGNNIIPVSIRQANPDQPAPASVKILYFITEPAGFGSNCLFSNTSEPPMDISLMPPRFPINETFSSFLPQCWNVRKNQFMLTKGYVPMNLPQSFLISHKYTRTSLINFIKESLESYKDVYNYICKCNYENTAVDCNVEDNSKQLADMAQSNAGYVSMGGDKIVFLSKQDQNDFLLYNFYETQLNRFGGYSIGKTRNDIDADFEASSDEIKSLVKREELYVLYDLKPRQAVPTYVNAINNVILRANIDPDTHGNPNAFGITLINHPLNKTKLMSLEYFETGTDVVIALFIIIAMSFVPASFVVFLVAERHSNAKHLQMVSGMSPLLFWISNYIWDMLNYLVPASACILILIWFDLDAYTSKQNLPVVVLLFLLFGWSITPMMYPASFLFTVPSTAYIVLIVGNLFFGVTAIMSVFLLDRFVETDILLMDVRYVLETLFLLLPNYNLGRCLAKLAINDVHNKYNMHIGLSHKIVSSLDWKVSGQALTAMAFEGMVFFVLTILIQYRFFVSKKRLPVTSDPIENEDIDVAAERSRVLAKDYKRGSEGCEDEIIFENLSKVYKKGKTNVLAVDRICLGVPQGECFGLLGVNGAGKTSTFKMLTGNASVSAGDAWIHNHSIVNDLKNVHSKIGYCPQFDALFGELTVSEHLDLYASIRGLHPNKAQVIINWVLDTLTLAPHKHKQTRTLSGGNKRKLSAAIALLGDPKVVLLDEPTSGMDPIARRFLWDLIKCVVRSGRSVILTSHSMEECEALCSRLAIMVNGHFKCLGSCQHLVNRFGDGYTVNVKVTGFAKQLRNFLRYFYRQYPTAVIIDRHQNQIQYQIASDSLNLAKLFQFLQLCVADCKVAEYSISQTTLERVFINFAREQTDEDINILREPLCSHKRTLSGVSDIGSLASEAGAGNDDQEFVSLTPNTDFHRNPNSPAPTQSFAPSSFLNDLHLDELPVAVNYNNFTPLGAQNSVC